MNNTGKKYLNKLIVLVLALISVFHAGCGKKDNKQENSVLLTEKQAGSQELRENYDPVAFSGSIHVFVALADNKSQGIVPVSKELGNGDDPRTNLYWGARYGMKTFFRKDRDWNFVAIEKNPSAEILERCFFRYRDKDVTLIADAYRGVKIKKALIDFLNAAAGKNSGYINIKGIKAGVGGAAGLVVYVGHNVLMDYKIKATGAGSNKQGVPAMVLACKSKQYFKPWLKEFNARPVLLTTGLMAPEAYTLKAALDGFVNSESAHAVKEKAAQAYNKYQHCGLRASRNLFYSE